jgi:hypothetical protein
MIAKAERKEAARQFKERKPSPGIYALRCSTTSRTWVDSSPNLDAAQNSQFFQLRQRLHRNKELQAEWNAHGEGSFSFEVLENFPKTPRLSTCETCWRSASGHGQNNRQLESNASKLTAAAPQSSILKSCRLLHPQRRSSIFPSRMTS